ncbi:hypothetical protein [Ligilactobacillus apodemi]|uniref:hypothetical protein n=1 Tax=Ligilactobacillus apodemi TaxID=307126 RepID=UPI00214CBFF8|nr:hypothetical protein [Ligilactobacillus apodemi]MCR1902255.1 hypothetical protein [Ligilactobacillus apodemi]
MDELSKMFDDLKEHSLKMFEIKVQEIAQREYDRGWNDAIKKSIEILNKDGIGGRK